MTVFILLPSNRDLIPRLRAGFPQVPFAVVETAAELIARVEEADALIIPNGQYTPAIAAAVKERGRKLKWIQFTTSGIDIAIKSGLPDNVVITNAAGANAIAVAEHGIALMLAVARCLNLANTARTAKTWPRRDMMSHEISPDGLTIAVVGLGNIGREIARKAKAFDMRVIGISRGSAPVPNVDEIRPRERLRETAAEADVLALAAVYDPSTKGMIDRGVIAAMKPSAIFVNIARGQLVDETALIEALQANRIFGAGIDVAAIEPPDPDSPLWTLPNVVMTPHSAGGGGVKIGKLYEIVSRNLTLWLAGQPMPAITDLTSPE
jgi:D-2-hydroxyacid dehydrogenase (NADP+)